MELADSLKVNVRLSEVVYSNGNKTFSPDITVYRNKRHDRGLTYSYGHSMFRPRNEIRSHSAQPLQNTFSTGQLEGYDSLVYPPAPLRLLGLMRYWSAIQYFCPNKDLIVKNWDSVLYEYVPKFYRQKIRSITYLQLRD
jgi:hypothetical protein